jgi:hypothetical protein
LCTTASSSAHRAYSMPKCAKNAFKNVLQNQKWYRKIQFWKAKEVLYFVCERHIPAAYTFAVAASGVLRYKKFKF